MKKITKKIAKNSYLKEILAIVVVGVLAVSLVAQASGASLLDRIANGVSQLVFGELKASGSLEAGELSFGAFPGPDINSPFLSVNGVETHYRSRGLNNSSTIICSLKSPSATSTLVFASLQIHTATSTELSIEVAKAANDTATSTLLRQAHTLSAGTQATLIASTTPSVFEPNYYINWKYSDTYNPACSSGSCNTIKGKCKAEFIVN